MFAQLNFSQVLVGIVAVSWCNLARVESILAPYIRARCNLGEAQDRGFCIDILGRFASDLDPSVVQGHSCKPSDVPLDLMFAFGNNDDNTFGSSNNNIGQIYGTGGLLDDLCVAVYCNDDDCSAYAADCKNTTALSVFKYYKNSLQFKLLGSVDDFNNDFSDSSSDNDSSSDDDELDKCLRLGTDTVIQGFG